MRARPGTAAPAALGPRAVRAEPHRLDDCSAESNWALDSDPRLGAWRSPVARIVWGDEVPGSNPGAPIYLHPLPLHRRHHLSRLPSIYSLPRAPVAQWTERRTSNPMVAGSNPAGGVGKRWKTGAHGQTAPTARALCPQLCPWSVHDRPRAIAFVANGRRRRERSDERNVADPIALVVAEPTMAFGDCDRPPCRRRVLLARDCESDSVGSDRDESASHATRVPRGAGLGQTLVWMPVGA